MGADRKEAGLRDVAMLVGVALVCLTFLLAVTSLGSMGPFDSAAGFVEELPKAKLYAVPAALAVFFLILALPRPPLLKRAVFSVLSGLVFWLVVWGLIVEFDYKQVRDRGADPEQILIHSRPY